MMLCGLMSAIREGAIEVPSHKDFILAHQPNVVASARVFAGECSKTVVDICRGEIAMFAGRACSISQSAIAGFLVVAIRANSCQ